jgi:hypothetical protein
MSVVGAALRGFGRALKRDKRLRPSKTGAIKSVKPGVGGLKKSRDMFEDLQKSVRTGVEKFGRPHTTKVLSELKGQKTMGSVTKQAGDLERLKKAAIKKHPQLKERLKDKLK